MLYQIKNSVQSFIINKKEDYALSVWFSLFPAIIIFYLSYTAPLFISLNLLLKILLPSVSLLAISYSGYNYFEPGYQQFKDIVIFLKNTMFNFHFDKDSFEQMLSKLDMNCFITLSCAATGLNLLYAGLMAPIMVLAAPLFTLSVVEASRLYKDYQDKKNRYYTDTKKRTLVKFIEKINKLKIEKDVIYNLSVNPGLKRVIIPVDCELLSGEVSIIEGTEKSGEQGKITKYTKGQVLSQGSEIFVPDSSSEAFNIEIKALCDGKDSHSYKIYKQQIQKIEQAQNSNSSNFRQVIELLTKYFIIAILAIAGFAFVFWSATAGLATGLQVMMDVLFAACPCALVIAAKMPIAILKKTLLNHNISVYNDKIIESLSDFNTIILDKSGTLTGRSLKLIKPLSSSLDGEDNLYKQVVLYAIYRAEIIKLNKNPKDSVASSIVNYFNNQYSFKNREWLEHVYSSFDERNLSLASSNGLIINLNNIGFDTKSSSIQLGNDIYIGNKDFMRAHGIPFEQAEDTHAPASAAAEVTEDTSSDSILYIANKQGLLFELSIGQELFPDAEMAIKKLKDNNIDIHILSGDTKEATYAIADKLGIDRKNVKAECSAERSDKLNCVEELQKDPSVKLLYIGDGENDVVPGNKANRGCIAKGHGSDTDGSFDVTINNVFDIFILKDAFSKATTLQDTVYAFSILLTLLGMFFATVVFPISGMVGMTHCLGMCMGLSSSIAALWCASLIPSLNDVIDDVYKSFGIKKQVSAVQTRVSESSPELDFADLSPVSLVSTSPVITSAALAAEPTSSSSSVEPIWGVNYSFVIDISFTTCCQSKSMLSRIELLNKIGILNLEEDNSEPKKYKLSFEKKIPDTDGALEAFEQEVKNIFSGLAITLTSSNIDQRAELRRPAA